jgi:TrmH family RNA methyltransferase
MLSKSRIKFIRSLRLTKFRFEEKLFIIEGDKLVREALNDKANSRFKIHSIYGLDSWLDQNQEIISPYLEITEQINNKELGQISNLKTPNRVLAIIHLIHPDFKAINTQSDRLIGLDNIQDPGNMGTIIRLADWFGIKDILLSPGCADPYNPKVVQATMGSIFRVKMHQIDLESWLEKIPAGFPVYGAILNGENIYNKKLSKKGIILFGNESQGLSTEIERLISEPITIPRGDKSDYGPESLNVSVALGIILSEFSRQNS